jgi:hypothetical protein
MTQNRGRIARPSIGLLAAGAIVSGCVVAASAQSDAMTSTGGITKLTAATRVEALECGNAGPLCAIEPYNVCPREAERYAVRLITPFSRVAAAKLEANRNNLPLGRMGPGAVNQWGVALSVSPAERSRIAEAITRLEIRKDDGTVIHPRWTTIGPITTIVADGSVTQLSRGFFVFPFETFSPASDLTVILFGLSGETTCAIDRQQLSMLR